jgi:hypothetical protein
MVQAEACKNHSTSQHRAREGSGGPERCCRPARRCAEPEQTGTSGRGEAGAAGPSASSGRGGVPRFGPRVRALEAFARAHPHVPIVDPLEATAKVGATATGWTRDPGSLRMRMCMPCLVRRLLPPARCSFLCFACG